MQSEYTYENVKDTSKGYDRYFGRVTFTKSLVIPIVINYKNRRIFNISDRVSLEYNPVAGQFGNDLSK